MGPKNAAGKRGGGVCRGSGDHWCKEGVSGLKIGTRRLLVMWSSVLSAQSGGGSCWGDGAS